MEHSPYKNPEENINTITSLGTYHPKRNGKNPKHDEESSNLLKFKKGDDNIVRQYFNTINPMLREDTDIAITFVPGHDPRSRSIGLIKLAVLLANQGRTYAESALTRTSKIAKLTLGGSRDQSIHIDSIKVDCSEVKGKIVVLLDDIMTSGNSISVCLSKIRDCEPKNVVALVLGQTSSN